MANYRKCCDCGRPMRPRGAKVSTHPGTVSYHGRRCGPCNFLEQRRRKPKPKPEPKPRPIKVAEEYLTPGPRLTVEENRANLRSWLRSMGYEGNSV